VRIALNLKGISVEHVPVNLLTKRQLAPEYGALNPQQRVPTLVLADGTPIAQSPAIIEWLEETYPTPPLFASCPLHRAKARTIAGIVCDTHPLHNSGTLNALRASYSADEKAVAAWVGTWISAGLDAIEPLIGDEGFCLGPEPGFADVFLIPQLYVAQRFHVPLGRYPKARRVEVLASMHPAFDAAHPARQIDAA
jgi:maleylacetoacetate isomerase/maleylpyruvate isomerase